MMNFKYIKINLLVAVYALMGTVFTSCDEQIELGGLDESRYESVNDIYCYIQHIDGPRSRIIEVREETSIGQVHIGLTKPANKAIDIQLKVDESLLSVYNKKHNTDFKLYPVELVSIEEKGAVLIAPGQLKSDPVVVSVKSESTLPQGTYALPIAVELLTEGVKLSAESQDYVLLVKVMGKIPSTDKGTGIITICYVEANGYNLLNAGEWTMKNSGKQFVDIVNIFAANINYNEKSDRMYVNINPNLQYILDNRHKYIKPLQDKGIKVCLSILGNHDGTGVANLSDKAARDFAAELKAIVDAYGLDGVDFDDEWSDYDKYPARPGFAPRGPYPFARLCYETKKIMPDKLCMVYYVGAVAPWPEQGFNGFDMQIEGMDPGDFIDYSYYAQYGAWNESYDTIKGMRRSQWCPYSLDLQESTPWMLDMLKNEGYGVQLIYDLRPTPWMYMENFGKIASKLYNDQIVHSGVNFEKDW